MREWRLGSKIWLLGSALLLGSPLMFTATEAAQLDRRDGSSTPSIRPHPINARAGGLASGNRQTPIDSLMEPAGRRAESRYHVSCVPYARQISGIIVPGNAWQWWGNATGLYARGEVPEPGSVLNFRPNGRMRLGHVAVVRRVVNAREVVVDQANWPTGGGRAGAVSHNVAVVDVSEANNWSAVRVEMDRDGKFGSVYPTYGFIYNRPDTGVVVASLSPPAPPPEINPVPSDLRPRAERPWQTIEEVAEASPRRQAGQRYRMTVTRVDR